MSTNHEPSPALAPLNDVLVVDLSRALAGPHATMIMADLGARVIKVEPPGHGDDTRVWGPPFVGPEHNPQATYFLAANRNKESIQLDLKAPADAEILRQLLRRADVLVENYRPGVLDRLGFSPTALQDLNPRLIVLSITGFGHDGPEGRRPGYDQIAQGEAGLMAVTGPDADHPTRIGVPIGDILAGLNGAVGVLAALTDRARTGRGTVVRTSLLAAMVGAHAYQGTKWTVAREKAAPTGNHHPQIAPYGAFACGDGHIQIAVGSERQWNAFAAAVGVDADDPRYRTNSDRMDHHGELVATIEALLSVQPRAHWLARLSYAGVPAGAIRGIDEVYEWEQTRSQGLVLTVEHPVLGRIALPGPAVRLETLDGQNVSRGEHTAPPLLNADHETVRSWLATSDRSITTAVAG